MRHAVFLLVALAGVIAAQAQTRLFVWNGASWGGTRQPTGGVAPGSLFIMQAIPEVGAPCFDLSKTTVRVQLAGGRLLDAPLVPAESYCYNITAMLPKTTPLGEASVTMSVNGQDYGPAPVSVVASSFGLYTQARNGLGPAAVFEQSAGSPGQINRLTAPALPGQYLTFYGTGLGMTTPPGNVIVQIAGRAFTPLYAGPAPANAGVDQINVQLPADDTLPSGCYLPISVRVGDRVSNMALLAKAAQPGACEHPLGVSADALAKLDEGGTIVVGTAQVASLVSTGNIQSGEYATVNLRHADAYMLSQMAEPAVRERFAPACTIGYNSPPTARPLGIWFDEPIDAGDSIRLSGPDNKVLDLVTRSGGSFYQAYPDSLLQRFFGSGSWQLTAPGGKSVKAFQAGAVIPAPLNWLNRDGLRSLDRTQDQVINWDPAGYTDADLVTVSLSSEGEAPVSVWGGRFISVDCRAPATAGKVTLPASLLRSLPATQSLQFAPLASLTVTLSRTATKPQVFTIPLTDGTTAPSYFEALLRDTVQVILQ